MSGVRNEERTADLQASQAVFCFRGGGKVFASSCMWLCADWEGRAKAGIKVMNRSRQKENKLLGPWGLKLWDNIALQAGEWTRKR